MGLLGVFTVLVIQNAWVAAVTKTGDYFSVSRLTLVPSSPKKTFFSLLRLKNQRGRVPL